MIHLSVAQLTEIQNHGKEAYPEECCGAMLGELESSASSAEQIKFTKTILRIENNWGNNEMESRHRRFAITAKDYQELEETAKKEHLVLLGFYHTHPDHPAKPSATDLLYAWPFFSYIILSIGQGLPKEILSYELNLEEKKFSKELLKIE